MKNAIFLGLMATVSFQMGWAQAADSSGAQAKKLLERISSSKVPSDHPLLAPIAEKLRAGDSKGAAELAMSHPDFLNVTVKLMALKMSTREETLRLPLNDFAATFIGVVRDQIDARELLTGNFFYMGNATKIPAGATLRSDMVKDLLASNNHYQDLSNPMINIGDVLMRVNGQKLLNNKNEVVDNPDPGGVLTSRTFMAAHASAGTNRRLVEFTFREFMCVPIEDWADTRASDIRIGRDIDRFPGGDHLKFQTTCKGCHTQMDSLRGAFAKWDFQDGKAANGSIPDRLGGFDGNGVSGKMNRNGNVHPSGYVTTNDSFINNSRMPANDQLFGWRGPDAGKGVQGLGSMVASSRRFSQCMVKRAYDAICRTELNPKLNTEFLQDYAAKFESNGYNLRTLFKEVAVSKQCQGFGG